VANNKHYPHALALSVTKLLRYFYSCRFMLESLDADHRDFCAGLISKPSFLERSNEALGLTVVAAAAAAAARSGFPFGSLDVPVLRFTEELVLGIVEGFRADVPFVVFPTTVCRFVPILLGDISRVRAAVPFRSVVIGVSGSGLFGVPVV
jgi:hypothetical protein